ncbi:D-amino-acid transaminase [Bacillus sp. FSL W7-1360]
MAYILWQGQIMKEATAQASLFDRGYQFGDGIYEMVRLYDGQFFALQKHLERLNKSAEKLDMTLPYTSAELTHLLYQLIQKDHADNGNVYVQVTRGTSTRDHLYSRTETPILSAYLLPQKDHRQAHTSGIAAYVTEDIRWLRCDIKSLNLLGNVMAKRQAADHQCAEAVLHRDGMITEGASTNIFLVNNGTLYTHPANNFILDGITRQEVIDIAEERHINVVQEPFPKEVLAHADEAFLTGTTIEIMPIHSFTGDVHVTLPIGPVTKRIQEAFTARIGIATTNTSS